MLQLTAIVPSKMPMLDPAKIQAGASRTLTAFATDMISRMAKYPPQQPPLRARYKPYRRTGDLGRHWQMRFPGPGQITVFNNVSRRSRAYAVYVEGPTNGPGAGYRQTAVMRAKGWQSITTISKELWNKHRGLVQTALVVG